MKLILASNSPRRREILGELGYSFTAVPSAFRELSSGLTARETALAFARGKAEEVFSRYGDDVVLGADTVVELEGEILGKPKSEEDAVRMLRMLGGKWHSVFTGVAVLYPGGRGERVVETKVFFPVLSDEEIAAYCKSGSPFDKAGGYGIQDFGAAVRREGSYTNVVGLPAEETDELLKVALGGSK